MDKVLHAIKNFMRDVDGVNSEKSFTDTHVFSDCCYIVKAEATVFFRVIDKETGQEVKDANVQFGLVAAHDSGLMTFEGSVEDVMT